MRKTVVALITLFVAMGGLASGAMAFDEDSLTMEKCSGCHEVQQGKMSRVEEIRATPDEWGVIIDRMARLHGMELNEGERDTLLKEICETQILSPEEMEKVSYLSLNNNPQKVEKPQDEQEGQLFGTCVRCHSAGKIFSYRMTESSWAKVRDFHYYMDPAIDGQMREMKWYDEAGKMLAYLAETRPYGQAWEAPEADLSGSWIILGHEPGKGNYRGYASIQNGQGGDYTMAGTLNFEDGMSQRFDGDAVLYGGHALRTETQHNSFETRGAYAFTDGIIQGKHHFPAPAFRTSTSTWYRADGPARVLRVTPSYLLSGEKTTLTLEGVKLSDVEAGDISFSDGNIEVLSAKRVGDAIVAEAVYRGSGDSKVQLEVNGLGTVPVTLADQIDAIKVTPELGRARVYGGVHFPAEGVQFEAFAYAGDRVLGPVPAKFKLTEYVTREGDDDLVWVGGIGENGNYFPTSDYGRIPTREYKTEGTGLVKVQAEYERGGRRYSAEADLAVVPPDYVPRVK